MWRGRNHCKSRTPRYAVHLWGESLVDLGCSHSYKHGAGVGGGELSKSLAVLARRAKCGFTRDLAGALRANFSGTSQSSRAAGGHIGAGCGLFEGIRGMLVCAPPRFLSSPLEPRGEVRRSAPKRAPIRERNPGCVVSVDLAPQQSGGLHGTKGRTGRKCISKNMEVLFKGKTGKWG